MIQTDDIHSVMNIDNIELHTVDLNLLVAFEALVGEASVTKAAARMGVTQSAMSHTLARLRALFDDGLLVRSGAGMVLTPRAEALVGPVAHGLAQLRRALSGSASFDPGTSERRFRVAGPDLFELLFLPRLLHQLGCRAPGVGLDVLARMGPDVLSALEHGNLDFAVDARMLDPMAEEEPGTPSGLMRRSLLRDGWRCFVRADHPALTKRGTISMTQFLRYPHAVVSPGRAGPGVVDVALARQGHERRVGLRVSHFYSAPVAIASTDLILTAPAALSGLLGHLDLAAIRPPIDLPEHSVDLLWHARMHDDPGHRWLRAQLVEIAGPWATQARRRGSR
jgi:DNA-binding transcriptional LysR family regulator